MTGSRIFICRVCGNIVMLVHKGGGPLSCCGQPMEELVANTTDAAQEKHGGFRQGQLFRFLAEIAQGGIPEPIVVGAEIDGVQVKLQDFILGVIGFHVLNKIFIFIRIRNRALCKIIVNACYTAVFIPTELKHWFATMRNCFKLLLCAIHKINSTSICIADI